MLSKVIKEHIETKFGREIRYPVDCEALAGEIHNICKRRISASTLKRLFGLVKGIKEPRLYTLDVIARYLGYDNWDVYLEKLNKIDSSEFKKIEEIAVENLNKGAIFEFGYEPDRTVAVEYKGKYHFEVLETKNSKLQKGDLIHTHNLVLNYPLLVKKVIRNGVDIGQYTAGKISGITFIRKIDDRKKQIKY